MLGGLEVLARAVKTIASEDLRALTDDELDEAVVEIQRIQQAVHAAAATITCEWERRKTWRASGSRSASAHLARRTKARVEARGSLLWLGRALGELSLVAAAFAAGDLTADHVRRLATAFGRTRAVFAEHEAALVSWALSKSFLEFCIELDVWLLEHDPDGTSKKARDQRDRRDAWLAESFDGMYLGQMTLDPIEGGMTATGNGQPLCRSSNKAKGRRRWPLP